jgi:hypothetical protein
MTADDMQVPYEHCKIDIEGWPVEKRARCSRRKPKGTRALMHFGNQEWADRVNALYADEEPVINAGY